MRISSHRIPAKSYFGFKAADPKIHRTRFTSILGAIRIYTPTRKPQFGIPPELRVRSPPNAGNSAIETEILTAPPLYRL